MSDNSGEEEVLKIAGVRERLAAYNTAVEKSKVVEKTTKVPVFQVEDGILHDSFVSETDYNDESYRDDYGQNIESTGNVHEMRPSGFFGENSTSSLGFFEEFRPTSYFGDEAEELGFESGMTFEDAKRVVFSARDKFKALINKFEPQFEEEDGEREARQMELTEEFVIMQDQYIEAVEKLRPSSLAFEKYQNFANLKLDYENEAEKKEAFGDMQDRWQELDAAQEDTRWYEWCDRAQEAPDLPSRPPAESDNEHQIDEKEEEIASQWIDFTNMVVETAEKIKAESDDDLSVDEDMEKWKEEARRLKDDAAKRKKRKEAMLARRNKRQESALERHDEFVTRSREAFSRREKQQGSRRDLSKAKKQSSRRELVQGTSRMKEEEEGSRRSDNDNTEVADSTEVGDVEGDGASQTEVGADAVSELPSVPKSPRKQVQDDDSDSSSSSDDDSEDETTTAARGDPVKISEAKADKKDDGKKDEKKKKKKTTKKDKKDKSKKKDKEKKGKDDLRGSIKSIKDVDVRSSTKSADPGKPCGDDNIMTDGPVERNPRHLDGSLWKNPLKFWTNKPKKLNEVGAKYILKTLPQSDCFRRTEKSGNDNASFYWFKAEGDFDVIVKIKGNFRSPYDKAGIMLREDDKNWVLSGIEFFNGELNHSTCITRGVSDWSLSPVPAEASDGLWICVKRIGGKVECFFSLDIKKWVQTRQGLFSNAQTVKVGIAAACPMGEPFKVVFERFRVKKTAA
mmetsp:Transcript_16297/g.35736  ORF Transcript_16297/g.35736 Transcript_16297/m.35736 type:complete len:738 (+) Transcript_16297:24-2237(+)